MTVQKGRFIRWFEKVGLEDLPLVGGKNASLGEMYRELPRKESRFPTASPLPPKLTGNF